MSCSVIQRRSLFLSWPGIFASGLAITTLRQTSACLHPANAYIPPADALLGRVVECTSAGAGDRGPLGEVGSGCLGPGSQPAHGAMPPTARFELAPGELAPVPLVVAATRRWWPGGAGYSTSRSATWSSTSGGKAAPSSRCATSSAGLLSPPSCPLWLTSRPQRCGQGPAADAAPGCSAQPVELLNRATCRRPTRRRRRSTSCNRPGRS